MRVITYLRGWMGETAVGRGRLDKEERRRKKGEGNDMPAGCDYKDKWAIKTLVREHPR
jgi:hypothetical protein